MADTIDKEAGLQQKEVDTPTVKNDNEVGSSLNKPSEQMSYFDMVVKAKTKPESTLPFGTKEEEWENNKDIYTEKYGDEGKDKFLQTYEALSQNYMNQARQELEKSQAEVGLQVFDQFDYYTEGMEGVTSISEYTPEVEVALETNSGSREMLDQWTDPTRSVRTAAIDSNSFLDDEGEVNDVPGSLFDNLIGNDEFTNKDGKRIQGFTYVPADKYGRGTSRAKAFYEGEEPEGEVISRWDANGWFKTNDLDMSVWKVPVATTTNFIVDVADTVLGIGEAVIGAGAMGNAENTSGYQWLRDTRNNLKSAKMSKSDADQSKLFTVNNILDMGIYTGLQLLSGRAMAAGFGALYGASVKNVSAMQKAYKEAAAISTQLRTVTDSAKALEMAKTAQALMAKGKKLEALISTAGKATQKSTLFMLGAMASKDVADEARKAGFGAFESSLIYTASLGGMMWVNQLSELGFERIGLIQGEKIAKEAARKVMTGIKPEKELSKYAIKRIVDKTGNLVVEGYKNAVKSGGYLGAMVSEGAEEQAELIMQEVVNHTSNAIATLGYKEEDRPHFKSVMDEGYWGEFMTNSVMSVLGGFMGGAMTKGIFFTGESNIDTGDLPVKGDQEDFLIRVAYSADRTAEGQRMETNFLSHLADQKEKGQWGRGDISTVWDKDNKRYKRMNELTEDEKKSNMSQADTLYNSVLAQYHYYKQAFKLQTGKYDEIIADNPSFGKVLSGHEMHKELLSSLNEKSRILNEAKLGEIGIDDQLDTLSKLKEKSLVKDVDGNTDDSNYLKELNQLSNTTNLAPADIEKLTEINTNIKAISSGEILETSFIDLILTKQAYKPLQENRLKNLVGADTLANENKEQELETALEMQAEHAEFFKQQIATGELSDEAKQLLLSNRVGYLPEDVKAGILELVNNTGMSLTERKSRAMQSVLSEYVGRVYQKTGNDRLLQNMDGKDTGILEKLNKAILEDPDSVPDILSKEWNDNPEDTPLSVFGDFSPEVNDDLVKTSYTMAALMSIAKADSDDSLGNVKYDLDKVSSDSYHESISQSSVYEHATSGTSFPSVEGAKTINEILGPDVMSKEKGQLRATIEPLHEIDKDSARQDFLLEFDESKDGSIRPSNIGLHQRYEALTGGVDPEVFSDLPSAIRLEAQTAARLAQVRFILETLDSLVELRKINVNILKNVNTPLTYLTSYLNDIRGFDMEQMLSDPKYLNDMKKGLEVNESALTTLNEKSKRLVKLAEGADKELHDAYLKDVVTYAKNTIEAVEVVFSRPEAQAIIDENPSLRGIQELANQASDFTSTTAENIDELFTVITEIRHKLREALATDPGNLGDKIASLSTIEGDEYARRVLITTLSPSDTTFSRIKTEYKTVLESVKTDQDWAKLQLPTIQQLNVIEEAVTAATTDLLTHNNKLSSLSPKDPLPIAVFSGTQGSGKTQVVAVQAAKIIQDLLSSNGEGSDIVFASNSESQAEKIKNLAVNAGIKPGTLGNGIENVTQKDIWELLVNSDISDDYVQLAKILESVGAIVYDEISYVEFDPNASAEAIKTDRRTAPTLNAILAQLVEVNKVRVLNGQTPLRILGLGDPEQGKFIEGSPSPRNPTAPESLKGDVFSVFNAEAKQSVYLSTETLEHSFRYQIKELDTAQKQIKDNLNAGAIGRRIDKTMQKTELVYNDSEGDMTGVQVSTSWNELINDDVLIKSIKKNMEDPEFELLIISGLYTYDGEIDTKSLLGEFLAGHKNDKRVRTKGFHDVQGDEATYVLVNIPDGHFIYDKASVEAGIPGEFKDAYNNRVDQVSMAIGRAHRYANIVLKTDFPITSTRGTTTEVPPGETIAFKKQWASILMDNVLKDYDVIPESELLKTPATGEVVIEKDTDNTPNPDDVFNKEDLKVGLIVILEDDTEAKIGEIYDTTVELYTVQTEAFIKKVDIADFINGNITIKKEKDTSEKNPNPKTTTDETGKQLSLWDDYTDPVESDDDDLLDPTLTKDEVKKVFTDLGSKGVTAEEVDAAKKLLEKERKDSEDKRVTDDIDSAIIGLDNIVNIIQGTENGEFTLAQENTTDESDVNVMKDIERTKGKILFFGHRGELGTEKESINSKVSDAVRIWGAAKSFGSGMKYSEYKDHYSMALGLSEGPAGATPEYNYSVISYEFKAGSTTVGYNHVIVAELNGKHIILGSLGKKSNYTRSANETKGSHIGKLENWMAERETQLKSIVSEYAKTKEVDEDSQFLDAFTLLESTILASDKKMPPSEKMNRSIANGMPHLFHLKSTININEFTEGLTTGSPVMGNASLLQHAAADGAEWSEYVPNFTVMQAGNFRKGSSANSESVTRINATKVGGKFPSNEKLVELPTNQSPFHSFEKGKLFADIDGHTLVGIKTTRGTIPFFKVGNDWIPALAYNKKGKTPVIDKALITEGTPGFDAELRDISLHLASLKATADYVSKGVPAYELIREWLSFDEGVFDITNPDTLKAELRRGFDKRMNTFFGNVRIPLRFAKQVWGKNGGPSSVSEPYVITRGKDAGKSVIFYTFDQKKDLAEMTESEMVGQFNKMMDQQRKNPTRMTNNRDGVGYIILDSDPKTLTQVYEMFTGVDSRKYSKSLNQVVTQGAAENRLIEMLVTAHMALNTSPEESKVAKLFSGLEGSISVEAVKDWKKKKGVGKTAELAKFLDVIFQNNNMGRLALAEPQEGDSVMTSLLGELKQWGGKDSDLKIIFDKYMSVPETAAIVGSYGVTEHTDLADLTILGGNGSKGKIALGKSGNPITLESAKTVVTFIDPDKVSAISPDTKLPPKLNLAKMLTLMEASGFNVEEILSQLDELLPMTKGLGKGVFVSPLTSNTKNTISKAVASTDGALEEELTTNVKQIRQPSMVVSTLENFSEKFAKKKNSKVLVDDVKDKSPVAMLLTEIDAITTTAEVQAMQARITKTEGLTKEERTTLNNAMKVANKRVKGKKGEVVPKSFQNYSLVEAAGIITDPTISMLLQQFDNLRPAISTAKEMNEMWIAGLQMVLGDNMPPSVAAYINEIQKGKDTFVELTEQQMYEATKKLKDSGDPIPPLNTDLDFISMETGFDGLMGVNSDERLSLLLEWSTTEGVEQAKLAAMLDERPNDPSVVGLRNSMDEEAFSEEVDVKDVSKKEFKEFVNTGIVTPSVAAIVASHIITGAVTEQDLAIQASDSSNEKIITELLANPETSEKVFSTALRQSLPDAKVKLLDRYLSYVMKNYYNIDSKLNATSLITKATASLPIGTVGQIELLQKIDEQVKTNVLSDLAGTSFENLSTEIYGHDYFKGLDPVEQDAFRQKVMPQIEVDPALSYYLSTYTVNANNETLSDNHYLAISQYDDIISSIAGLSEQQIESLSDIINNITCPN